MSAPYSPSLAHCGVFCRDIEALTKFYCEVFDMQETDRGQGFTFPFTIVFLSARGGQHHQLALASGRGAEQASTVMQLSFKVRAIDELREARRRALARGATGMRGLNHGNALSIYFSDPEGNTVEVYLDTPWQVKQPHGDPLDIDAPDEQIWAETERVVRADPTFLPAPQWAEQFEQRQAKLRESPGR